MLRADNFKIQLFHNNIRVSLANDNSAGKGTFDFLIVRIYGDKSYYQ